MAVPSPTVPKQRSLMKFAREPEKVAKSRITVAYMLNQFEDGGAERQLIELIRRLDRTRFRPLLFLGSAGGVIADELPSLDIPIRFVRGRAGSKLAFVSLARELRRENVDIVHSWMFAANTWGRLAGRLAGVPVIVASERGLDSDLPAAYRWIDVALAPLSTKVIVNSSAVGEHAHRTRFIPYSRLVNIYNGVDLAPYAAEPTTQGARWRLGFPVDGHLIGMVASLCQRKRWDLFLRALKLLNDKSEVTALCVGEGELRAELNDLSKRLGLRKRVHFLGSRADIPEINAALDVAVLSSDDEGMPNALMQAMAASRPVVATDAGGTRELVIDGETGFVVPCGDAFKLADRIGVLLQDGDLRERFGNAGRRRVSEHFTFDACVARTVGLYETLLEKSPAKILHHQRA